MRHQKYRQWLLLSLYGELDRERLARLREHLEGCSACRDELDDLRGLHAVADGARIEPDPNLLDLARAQFRGALSSELRRREQASRRPRWWARWNFSAPQALTAAACLLAGLALGLLWSNRTVPGAGLPPAGEAELRIADVTWIDSLNGELEIQMESVRPVRLRGNVDEPRIRAALAQTLLNSGNPGLRMRAVGALGETPSRRLDEDVKRALIHSLKFDENAGVRKRALNALSETAIDGDIKEAFLQVLLGDENPGLRVAAIGALEAADGRAAEVDPKLLKMLEERLDTEDNDYIRLRSKAFLQEARYQ